MNDLLAPSQDYEFEYSGGYIAEIFTFVLGTLTWGFSLYVFLKGSRSSNDDNGGKESLSDHITDAAGRGVVHSP